jgi:hypothetical protein
VEGTTFAATHVVSAEGAAFWSEPDPNRAAEGRLDPHLPVQLLTETTGWAQVRCSNGWETWIDSRYLAVPAAPAPYATPVPPAYSQRAAPDALAIGAPLVGAALAVLGGFLPWISGAGEDISAWDIPVKSLFDTQNVDQGLDTGPILLVLLVTVVPLFTRRSLPQALIGVLAGLTVLIALLGFRLFNDVADFGPGIDLGFGLVLTMAGGLVLVIGAVRRP